nr:hypothetical protein [Rhodococcus sp. (in: high G+C Gram-positive bacteria)]
MSQQTLDQWDELRLALAPHLISLSMAFLPGNTAGVKESDLSALLAMSDFMSNELVPAHKEALTEIERLNSKLRHPAGKNR